MDRVERTSIREHLALHSSLTLEEFCERLRGALGLSEFSFDSENETEWGLVDVNNIEYNVSRPYKIGTLQQWDNTVPQNCNFGVSLSVFRGHPSFGSHEWSYSNLVVPVAEAMAKEFNTPVFYHRTWFKEGKNIERKQVFSPKSS